MDLTSVKPEWIGGFLAAVVAGIVKALGPMLARAVTRRFKAAERELDAMDENKREEDEAAVKFAKESTVVRLEAEIARLREDIRGLGDDYAKLAGKKTAAEQERDEWKRLAEEAVVKERRLRDEITSGHQGLPITERPPNAQVPTHPRDHGGPSGTHGARPDGGRPTDRPVRPKGRSEGR